MTDYHDGETLAELSVAELITRGRELAVPFALSLVDEHGAAVELRCLEVLRLLPRRRLVVRCTQAGKPRVLKLFMGANATKYRTREQLGVLALSRSGVPTPAFLSAPVDPFGDGQGLLFEYLDAARPITENDDEAIDEIAALLGKLHTSGIWHSDLHLSNFVKDSAGTVHAIDGDGIRRVRGHRPLGERASLENLARLLAQLPPMRDARLREPLAAYSAARGWSLPAIEWMSALTRRQRSLRTRRYLKKTQRPCTEFYCERQSGSYVVCERDSWGEAMAAFVEDPEAVFVTGRVLKSGNSATVVRAKIGTQTYVIKRYNVKSVWHGIRRALKPASRFRRAWCNGQRLAFLRIPSAKPVALVERWLGPVRGVAYLVMPDMGDNNLITEVTEQGLSETVVAGVTRLFCALQAADLTHGDMKATNFLVCGTGVGSDEKRSVYLIDLDGMGEGSGRLGRDVQRFLANWDDLPEVQETFHRAFVTAELPISVPTT
ncbi:MAG: hypothetical protein O7F71_20165 [Gammaproteobacteria bacterium]|nr:hypothetical protein [Gammaproteobacteria bacterium]